MLPLVVVLWIAIRILVEFVFPFSPFSKSQRHQFAGISVLYTFLEEIWQSLFAWHSRKNLMIPSFCQIKSSKPRYASFNL